MLPGLFSTLAPMGTLAGPLSMLSSYKYGQTKDKKYLLASLAGPAFFGSGAVAGPALLGGLLKKE